MTPAEWVIALLISYWVLRGGLADLVAAARGGTPARVAEGRTRARGGRYGAGGYLRDLWGDSWRVARARREARVARRLEHIRTHGPGPSWRERAGAAWARGWDRWERRMAARWDIRQRTDGRPQPEPVAPAAPAAPPTDGPAARGPEDQQRSQTGDDPGSPGAGRATSPGGGDQDTGPEARPRPSRRGDLDQGDAARPGQTGPELTARPLGGGRWVVDPDPHRAGETRKKGDPQMAEVTGLASALAHAQQMRRAYEDSVTDAERYVAGLESGGVSGEALTSVQQAMEAQQAAAAAWAQAEATLTRHMAVREAYEANQGAGSREFVTSE